MVCGPGRICPFTGAMPRSSLLKCPWSWLTALSLFVMEVCVVGLAFASLCVQPSGLHVFFVGLALALAGGGATGHPVEYIQLDRRLGAVPETCKYCGVRFQMKAHGEHPHFDTNPPPELPAGRAKGV